MSIYILRGPALPDWGDYSDILVSGWSIRDNKEMLELLRTGPFIPPISFPNDTPVVTEILKTLLMGSGLSGFRFRPVIKRHIVRLEWENWIKTSREPQLYPDTGEPEDYIKGKPHSVESAEQMGNLWEVVLEDHADLVPHAGIVNWDGTDWFSVRGSCEVYVSARTKDWLRQTVPDWVGFQPVPEVAA
jgi:hypothetical protein